MNCGRCGLAVKRAPTSGLCAACWRATPLFLRVLPDPETIADDVLEELLDRALRIHSRRLSLMLERVLPLERLPEKYRESLCREAWDDGHAAAAFTTEVPHE